MSEISRLIYQDYLEAVALSPNATPQLKAALKTNERVPAFLENLQAEVHKNQHLLDRQSIKQLVYDLTNVFILVVEGAYRQREMSDLALMAEKAKQEKKDDLTRMATELDKTGSTSIEGVEVKLNV